MRMYDIIDKKRNYQELTEQELSFFLKGYISGEVPDYQASAFLMAICFAGMSNKETAALTKIMASSGEKLNLSQFNFTVDKHSTGGVGDKTTLIIAPIVASLGCTVAKLSGRGLGHTGGTIDKLESVKGLSTDISNEDFVSIANQCGICVSSAGANLVPADKRLYALRDVTATVSSVPLIASSIMSKKLAGGANSIVLDVKTGNGAFMKTYSDAKLLAESMVNIGKSAGKNVAAVITNMNRPLGKNIGNALEIAEAANLLKGENSDPALLEICITLASQMVSLAKEIPAKEAREAVTEVIKNKSAYNRFIQWLSLQGGDTSVLNDLAEFTDAKYKTAVTAPQDGYISAVNAYEIGSVATMLGAGRNTKEDIIDMSAGIILNANVGDYVKKGSALAYLQSSTVADQSAAQNRFIQSLTFSQSAPAAEPLVYEIIT